jgi:histidinol-phosphate aminotransferase
MSFLTFFNSGKPIFFPDITYSFYDVWAELFRIPYECQPLDENLCIRKEDYYGENGGVVFPNPNAPTGVLLPLSDIEDIILHNRDVICIVDEAYIDFGGESALPLIDKYDNVLVVQTFSKSRSMAGGRIGYAFGNEKLIRCLNDVKYSFNSYTMDQLTLVNAVAALEDEDYFRETLGRIVATRERMKTELSALGFSMPDSGSNFLFITHERVPARELFAMLRERHIYVRYFDKPRIDNWLRVTIGTDQEMDQFIACLKEYLC